MVETALALLTSIVAAVAGYPMGLCWARGKFWCLALGVLAGEACVGLFLALSLAVDLFWPASLDAHRVGNTLVTLIAILPSISVLMAWFGYRKSLGIDSFCNLQRCD